MLCRSMQAPEFLLAISCVLACSRPPGIAGEPTEGEPPPLECIENPTWGAPRFVAEGSAWSILRDDWVGIDAWGRATLVHRKPDTIKPNTAHRYDPATDEWTTLSFPAHEYATDFAGTLDVGANGHVNWLYEKASGGPHVWTLKSSDTLWDAGRPLDSTAIAAGPRRVIESDRQGNTLVVAALIGPESTQWTSSRFFDAQSEVWGETQRVAEGTAFASPLFGFDAQGNGLLVNELAAHDGGFAWRRFDAASRSWGPEEQPIALEGWGTLSVADTGAAVFAFSTQTSLEATLFDPDQRSWSEPITLDTFSDETIRHHAVQRFDDGSAIVAYVKGSFEAPDDSGALLWSRFDGESWSAPSLLAPSARHSSNFELERDACGRAWLMWTSVGENEAIRYWLRAYDARSGTWGDSEELFASEGRPDYEDLTINQNGEGVWVWVKQSLDESPSEIWAVHLQ